MSAKAPRRAARSLALLSIALLVSIALAEAVLRALRPGVLKPRPPAGGAEAADALPVAADPDWALDDPELGWKNRPGTGHPDEPGRAPMHFWPDGERASAPAPDKPAGRRVLLIGCSFTEGFGVRDDETFAWRLNALHPDVRFENRGVPGYGTYQSLLLLERLLRESRGHPPDLVVYSFIGDHTKRNVAAYKWIRNLRDSRGLYSVPPHVTLEGDGLSSHPAGRIDRWPLERHSYLVTLLHDAWLRYRLADRDEQKTVATNRLIERMAREVEEAGSRLLVAQLDDLPPETLALLAERRIATVDCVEPRFKSDPSYRVGGVGHPSGLRHALWAECLERELEAEGFLPGARAARPRP